MERIAEVFNYSSNSSDVPSVLIDLPADDRWAWWIKQILTPVIVAVGIGGNCLSFIVMKTKSWRHKSYSHFLCALAVFDSLTLINRQILLVHELRIYAGDSGLYANFTDVACSIHNFYEHMCYLMSSWLIVCMAMERIVAVYFPLRKAFLCTPNGGVIVILVLIIVLTYTQVFRFFMVGQVDGKCGGLTEYLSIYTSLHVYLYQFTLIFILPVLIVLTCNILVLCKIYRVSAAGKPSDEGSNGLSRSRRTVTKTHKTTLMLLAISFIYLLTLLPSVLISIIVHVAIATRYRGMRELFVKLNPLTELFEICSDLNYCSNFFIYILSGKMFRYELRKIFSLEKRNTGSAMTLFTKTRDNSLKTKSIKGESVL